MMKTMSIHLRTNQMNTTELISLSTINARLTRELATHWRDVAHFYRELRHDAGLENSGELLDLQMELDQDDLAAWKSARDNRVRQTLDAIKVASDAIASNVEEYKTNGGNDRITVSFAAKMISCSLVLGPESRFGGEIREFIATDRPNYGVALRIEWLAKSLAGYLDSAAKAFEE